MVDHIEEAKKEGKLIIVMPNLIGIVDEIRFHDKALTKEEITEKYARSKGKINSR